MLSSSQQFLKSMWLIVSIVTAIMFSQQIESKMTKALLKRLYACILRQVLFDTRAESSNLAKRLTVHDISSFTATK